MSRRRAITRLTIGLMLGTAAVGLASAASPHGPKLVVRVGESFEVNGRSYPPGSLSLQSVARYNPSTTLDEVWIGSDCLGLLIAEKGQVAVPSDHDRILFERNAAGRLVLVGYVLRGAGDQAAFR